MIFDFKPLSRKNSALLITIMGIVVLSALLILGISINRTNEANNRFNSIKSFHQKYKALEQELKRIDQHQLTFVELISKTPESELTQTFKALQILNQDNPLFQNHWFVITDNNQNIISSFSTPPPVPFQTDLKTDAYSFISNFYTKQDSLYGSFTNAYTYGNSHSVFYGFTLNMQKVHEYLSSIDVVTPNYAYIFDQTGLCIFHPEIEMIGKNVFDFANLKSQDTLTVGNTKNPPLVLSEYLNIETYRFIDRLNTNSFKGYISINFPKVNLDENIHPIKVITYWIFLLTVSVIALLFYFFNKATKRAYAEKELLAVENEKFHKEKALVQLQQLKNQINPHFLFNSLNSLYMLVDLNPKEAQKFTLHLSKIYRYLINPPQENVITLQEEIAFIKEYIQLQKIRFKDELIFEVDGFSEADLKKKIPYLGLQIVVENALKHNIATREAPLIIKIEKIDKNLVVINNLQKKRIEEPSSNFGHRYLKKIYALYSNSSFEAQETDSHYICKLPLLTT